VTVPVSKTLSPPPLASTSAYQMEASSLPPTLPYLIYHHSRPLLSRPTFFPVLANSALLSISQFCNNEFEARFDSQTIFIMRRDAIILQDSRNRSTGLWQIGLQPVNLPPPPRPIHHAHNTQPMANSVHELQVKQDIVTDLHRVCFSLVPSTWLKAIDATVPLGPASPSISFTNTS
jgi:hypothetical protein